MNEKTEMMADMVKNLAVLLTERGTCHGIQFGNISESNR